MQIEKDLRKINEWKEILPGDKFPPFYYFYGNDQYLLERALQHIKKRFLTVSPEGSISFISAAEGIVSELLSEVYNASLFSPTRLIIIKESHLFKSRDWHEMLFYLKNPVSSITLIFISEKLELERPIYTLFAQKGKVFRCDHPFESQLPFWIRKIAGEMRKEITSGALSLLMEIAGNDLLRIHSELEKISLYLDKDNLITEEAIRAIVAGPRTDTIFSLIDCLGRKDIGGSLIHLWRLIDSGQPPLLILSLISWQFRLIARAKEMIQKGVSESQVRESLQIKSRTFLKQLSYFSSQEVRNILNLLTFTDLKLKSSYLNKVMILEELVLNICKGAT